MEGLLIGLIVMALGALFSQKKTDEGTGKPKNPVQTTRQRTVKRAEDYAKEIYGELQTQMKEQPEKTRQIARKAQETVSNSRMRDPEPVREVTRSEKIGRLSVNQPQTAVSVKTSSAADDIFPLEKEDLKKSIILSEILLPPKSKR